MSKNSTADIITDSISPRKEKPVTINGVAIKQEAFGDRESFYEKVFSTDLPYDRRQEHGDPNELLLPSNKTNTMMKMKTGYNFSSDGVGEDRQNDALSGDLMTSQSYQQVTNEKQNKNTFYTPVQTSKFPTVGQLNFKDVSDNSGLSLVDMFGSSHGNSFSMLQKPASSVHVESTTEVKDRIPICSVCGKVFIQHCQLKRHMRSHTNERPFVCQVCGKGFNHASNLNIHMNIHANKRPYVCKECGKGFNQSSALKTHMNTHSTERPHICKECGQGFNQKAALNVHMNIHENKRAFVCNECGKGFNQNASLKKHMRVHTNKEKPAGKRGPKGSQQKAKQKASLSDRKENKMKNPVTAQQNQESDTTHEISTADSPAMVEEPISIREKAPIIINGVAIKQEFCRNSESFYEKVFGSGTPNVGTEKHREPNELVTANKDSNSELKVHTLLNDRMEEDGKAKMKDETLTGGLASPLSHQSVLRKKIDKCTLGSPAQTSNDGTVGHSNTDKISHSNNPTDLESGTGNPFAIPMQQTSSECVENPTEVKERIPICSVCGKVFLVPCQLKRHMRIHTNERPFICKVCDKGFNHASSLFIHSNIHANERQYVCKECGRGFNQSSALKAHINTHSNVRPHICKECGQGFNQKAALNVHIGMHENKRSFVCGECGKGFNQNSSLKKHMRIHMNREQIAVDESHKGFCQSKEVSVSEKEENTPDTHLPTHGSQSANRIYESNAVNTPSLVTESISVEPEQPLINGVAIKQTFDSHENFFEEVFGRDTAHNLKDEYQHPNMYIPDNNETKISHSSPSDQIEEEEMNTRTKVDSIFPNDGMEGEQNTKIMSDSIFPSYLLGGDEMNSKMKANTVFSRDRIEENESNTNIQAGYVFSRYRMKEYGQDDDSLTLVDMFGSGNGNSFSSSMSVKRAREDHVENTAEVKDRIPICSVCGKVFIQYCQLKRHMRSHTNERPYVCQVCGKGFNHASNLNIHMKIHENIRQYVCKECGKGFNQSPALKAHMYTHAKERPFKCKECGKGFNQKTALQMHMNTHSVKKPHVCNECGKGFISNAGLKKHMKIHMDDLFLCSECGKQFHRYSYLKEHMKVHNM